MAEAQFSIDLPRGVQANFEDVTDENVPALHFQGGRMFAPPAVGTIVELRVIEHSSAYAPYGRPRTSSRDARVVQVVHQPAYDGDDEPMIDVHVSLDLNPEEG